MTRSGIYEVGRGGECRGDPDAGEEARQKIAIGIAEQAAHQDRAGHWIDFRRDVVEESLVGKPSSSIQADIERYLAELLDGEPALELVADVEERPARSC